MALVRVYCGLASADATARPASAGAMLVAAVVDDAGRLLDVCEIGDDPAGYAQLGATLIKRSGGPNGPGVAADTEDHFVTALLAAAGRPLAIADDDSVDDFAERFADDESPEERESSPAARRAVGLARALQAGALSAMALPVTRDFAGFKPVLAAHAALANGRHSAAAALREVLRELYPAALRAYPDPAEPVSLAVLDALPEPGMLDGARGRDANAVAGAAARLVAAGVADEQTVEDAVTALRVAVAETPRRSPANKTYTAAAAAAVRQAVAAVRACDEGCAALVATLAPRATPATAAAAQRPARRLAAAGPSPIALPSATPRTAAADAPADKVGRRERSQPPAAIDGPATPQPVTAPPVAPQPVTRRPVTPAAAQLPVSAPPGAATAGQPARRVSPTTPLSPAAPAAAEAQPPANRPVSAPPPPPPGITPITPGQRTVPPVDAGEPFRATLTTAAINSARAERRRPTPIPASPPTNGEDRPSNGFSATDLTVPVPTPRPAADTAPPGSRANWPLVNSADDRASARRDDADRPVGNRAPDSVAADQGADGGRVTPPWLADDLPPEPPTLRLVEPPPLVNRAMRNEPAGDDDLAENRPLRLVEPEPVERQGRTSRSRRPAEIPSPPVTDEGDGDLLIFAAARSAWFTGQPDDAEVHWSSTADSGWRAAQQAARPAVGDETKAGLPKRVPQANLVPGSPLRDERPLHIVRDPANIAANTTGYFQGWRRGQEINGYAVGGRPGRESAGGWDFHRDEGDHEDSRDYEYRSVGYRS